MAFHDSIRVLTTNDTNHADNFNEVYNQLLDNTKDSRDKITVLKDSPDFTGVPKVQGKTIATIEEGTWTPKLGNWAHTYSLREGTYCKVGKQVTIRFRIVVATKDVGATGGLLIGGLPFAPKGDYYGVTFSQLYAITLSSNYMQYAGRLVSPGIISIMQFSNGSWDYIPYANLSNGAEICGSATYFIS